MQARHLLLEACNTRVPEPNVHKETLRNVGGWRMGRMICIPRGRMQPGEQLSPFEARRNNMSFRFRVQADEMYTTVRHRAQRGEQFDIQTKEKLRYDTLGN